MSLEVIKNPKIYCPNHRCCLHKLEKNGVRNRTDRFYSLGFYRIQNGKMIRRYLCRQCGRSFSSRQSTLDFGMKKPGLHAKVFALFVEGLCNRQIARILKIDEKTVRRRIQRLSEQSLIQHKRRIAEFKIAEPVCYDGLENFAVSQYEPNNINQAIGRDSLFIYDFSFCPINRKGRMSDRQKLKKEILERTVGKFRKDSVCQSSSWLFKRLLDCKAHESKLTLLSDQHFQYPWALDRLGPRKNNIEHITISSKAPRVYRHILFPVNHADLLVRQHVKAFQRETISFSKYHGRMVQKFALFMAWKNYFRPQFMKKQKLNPKSNTQTPAMALGIESKELKYRNFFNVRYLPTQISLGEEWNRFHRAEVPDFRTGLRRA